MKPSIESRPTDLPRETNLPRILSLLRRSADKVRAARRAYRAFPGTGTAEKRRERILAFLAVRAKVAFVRVNTRPKAGPGALIGRARWAHLRRTARAYRVALARWTAFYQGTLEK